MVDALPPDYFDPASLGLLAQYCAATSAIRHLSSAIDEAFSDKSETGLQRQGRLIRLRSTETMRLIALSRQLRLGQQQRHRRETAATAHGRGRPGLKPWES